MVEIKLLLHYTLHFIVVIVVAVVVAVIIYTILGIFITPSTLNVNVEKLKSTIWEHIETLQKYYVDLSRDAKCTLLISYHRGMSSRVESKQLFIRFFLSV